MAPPPATLKEALSLTQTSKTTFETVHPPEKMGNAANIAYGGYAVAIAAKAAYLTVNPGYHLYSLQGNFLGPALTDRKLRVEVKEIRQTRTFATRQVEVFQTTDDEGNSRRACLIAVADFMVGEKALLNYSAKPKMKYTPVEQLTDTETAYAEFKEKLVREKILPRKVVDMHGKVFGPLLRFWEGRQCPEGIFAQNLTGMAKGIRTSQEGLQLPDRTTAEYFRLREGGCEGEVENVVALCWHMDAALSFLPLALNHLFLDDAGACSSLDFSLRLFGGGEEDGEGKGHVRVGEGQWFLKEMGTVVGGEGRTYSESRVWGNGGKGGLVASMTQQSILRVKPEGKGKGKGAKL